jgi:cyclophilin family peptidyl-prolyl cis-trans isomerase
MTNHFRPILALTAAAVILSSCSTVNKAVDRGMNVFRGKDKTAEELAVIAESEGKPAALPARSQSNTALMIVEINGVKRKVVIQLKPELAPKTVANFKKLAGEGFFDGLAFHRAIKNYIVQTGDPNTKTEDKKDEWGLTDAGYTLAPELKGLHTRGAVAMARPGDLNAPDKSSSGSQFFVSLRTQKRFDGNYSVFGEVTQGLEVLEAVSAVTVDTNDTPVRRVNIKSVRLVSADSPDLLPDPLDSVRKTKPNSEKGFFERFIERIW